MRRLVLACLSLLACSRSPDRSALEADVEKTLDAWHDAAARADEEAYFNLFAKDGVFLGTDAKERWSVSEFRAYAHPHFAKGKAWTFKATRRAITLSSDARVAWFDEDLATPHLGPSRGSGVLVREGEGAASAWRIAHYDLSVPIPNEKFKDVKAVIDKP
jgi:uncharacterized protein (TIGR02246 family)